MKRLALGFMVVVLVMSSTAVAGDKEEAKRLFESGLKLMKVDDFAAAAANFERSSALYPTQNSLFNLANCYKAMQRYEGALNIFKRLREQFGGKLKPEIQEASAHQEAEIRSIVATLILKVEPQSAKVVVDGRELTAGAATAPLLLAPGDHNIEASLAGYRTLRRSVRLVSGAQRSESVVLEVEPGYLSVRSDTSGAGVFVDGVEKGRTPLGEALVLPPGSHVVALRMPGGKEAERKVEIRAGEREVLDFAPASFDATMPPSSYALEQAAGPGAGLATTATDVTRPRTRYWKAVAWSTAAGALLAGGTAMVFWKVFGDGHFSTAQDYADQYKNNPSDQQLKDKGVAEYNLAVRDGKIAIGLGIGAGVLAVASVAAFIADSAGQKSQSSPAVLLAPAGLRLAF